MSDAPPPPPPPSSSGDPASPQPVKPVSPLTRLSAFAAGLFLIAAVVAVCFGIGWMVMSGARSGDELTFEESFNEFVRSVFAAVLGSVPAVVFFFWARKQYARSTTPGLKLMHLRIVDVRTGSPVTTGKMLLRELVGKFGILIAIMLGTGSGDGEPMAPGLIAVSIAIGVAHLLAAAIMVLRTPNRQATWDYIAKTTVVKAD